MKKIISILLVAMMLCSLTACGGKNESNTPGSGHSALEALPDDATPAQKVVADFADKAVSGEYNTPSLLADAMMQADHIVFSPASMEVEPGYLNGFTEEIRGFSEGIMFGPAIGSIPFIGYIFVSENPDDLLETLKASADLRWNVCTQADDMQGAVVDNMVCFVMSPATFEE